MNANAAWSSMQRARALALVCALAAIASLCCLGEVIVVPAEVLIAYDPVILRYAEIVGVEVGFFPIMMAGLFLYLSILLVLGTVLIWWQGIRKYTALVRLALEREQGERALFQHYLDELSTLLAHSSPLPDDPQAPVWLQTRVLSWEAMHAMGGRWQALLLHFLAESGLLTFLRLPALEQGQQMLDKLQNARQPLLASRDQKQLVARTLTFLLFVAAVLAFCWGFLAALTTFGTDVTEQTPLGSGYKSLATFLGIYSCNALACILLLAGGGVWLLFGRKEPLQEQMRGAWRQHQEEMLQGYLRRVHHLWPLQRQHPSELALKVLNAQTLMLIRELDEWGKATLIQSLYEAGAVVGVPRLSLRGADLRRVVLAHRKLAGICLAGSDLSGANFQQATLRQAVFHDCNLADADLRGADLSSSTMEKANLSRALLHRAVLTHVNLAGANLTDANLWEVDGSDELLTPAQRSAVRHYSRATFRPSDPP